MPYKARPGSGEPGGKAGGARANSMTGIKGQSETKERPGNRSSAGIRFQGRDPDIRRWYEGGDKGNKDVES